MNLKPRQEHSDPAPDAGFETICTHFAEDYADRKGAAAPPIYQTSTFIYPDAQAFETRRSPDSPHYDYTRVGNPTTAILEAKLARLERADWAYCFGSGMGAVSAAINACVHSGAHVVAHAHVYGPTQTYLNHLKRFGVETTYVNAADPQRILAAVRPETRLIYLESPTSGLMEVIEIEPITRFARERGIAALTVVTLTYDPNGNVLTRRPGDDPSFTDEAVYASEVHRPSCASACCTGAGEIWINPLKG